MFHEHHMRRIKDRPLPEHFLSLSHTGIYMEKNLFGACILEEQQRVSKHNQSLLFSCYSNPLLQRPFVRMAHHFPMTIWSQLKLWPLNYEMCLNTFHDSVVTISELGQIVPLLKLVGLTLLCMKSTAYVTYIKNMRECLFSIPSSQLLQ